MTGIFRFSVFSDKIKKKQAGRGYEMTIRLAERIRTLRKARNLTQEQLAEVLGVTVGAVYKWEAGLSTPELRLIVELADFFDTSVDVLLGYEMKDNRLQATVALLKKCRRTKDRAGLAEAEKALKKYPNSFEIIYHSAVLYRVFAIEEDTAALPQRALELYERARLLLVQNTDPSISEATLCGEMAQVFLALRQPERAVALWKQYNAGGLYNGNLGFTLAADCSRPDEALPFLSEALLNVATALIHVVMGYVNVYLDRKTYTDALEVLQWGISALDGLRDGRQPCFLDKTLGVLMVCLAYAQEKSGDEGAARSSLSRARSLAVQFDAAPNYGITFVRFVAAAEPAAVYDDLGTTALEGLANTVRSLEDDKLTALWREACEDEA